MTLDALVAEIAERGIEPVSTGHCACIADVVDDDYGFAQRVEALAMASRRGLRVFRMMCELTANDTQAGAAADLGPPPCSPAEPPTRSRIPLAPSIDSIRRSAGNLYAGRRWPGDVCMGSAIQRRERRAVGSDW
jgi:hypothetical protein